MSLQNLSIGCRFERGFPRQSVWKETQSAGLLIRDFSGRCLFNHSSRR
jgi:hypothetical protein